MVAILLSCSAQHHSKFGRFVNPYLPECQRMSHSTDPYEAKQLGTQSPTPEIRRPPANEGVSIPGHEILGELGAGGMGVVYWVRRHTTGTILPLKMIPCGRDATLQALARFRIEADAMACLDHPNIIQIRDNGLVGGYPYFALEFAERGTLKQLINHHPQ